MIISQTNRNTGNSKQRFEFILYSNLSIDGRSKSTNTWRSYLDRANSKYMSFKLELIYDT